MSLLVEFGLVLSNDDVLSTPHLPIYASGDILSGVNLCFRVFKNQLIVINRYAYACICSRAEQTKFIKVTCAKMKQVSKRMFNITDIKAKRNQMMIKRNDSLINFSLILKKYR